jgi:hypothetical protein
MVIYLPITDNFVPMTVIYPPVTGNLYPVTVIYPPVTGNFVPVTVIYPPVTGNLYSDSQFISLSLVMVISDGLIFACH